MLNYGDLHDFREFNQSDKRSSQPIRASRHNGSIKYQTYIANTNFPTSVYLFTNAILLTLRLTLDRFHKLFQCLH